MKVLFWLCSLAVFYIIWTTMGFEFREAGVAFCAGSLVGVALGAIR